MTLEKGWIVAAVVNGEECSLIGPGKRGIRGRDGSQIGEAAWVTKRDHAGGKNKNWWKKYAWTFETKYEAMCALEILDEKVKAGQCSKFNLPSKFWVEEL